MMVEAAEILLVEDNPADVELTQYMMRKGKLLANLHVAPDGFAAMDFLRREKPV
jgi:CheY-like chemotaxis protein